MPALKQKQAGAAKRAGINGKRGQQIAEREPRVSTTDPDARVMPFGSAQGEMANGGYNPATLSNVEGQHPDGDRQP
jgi:hypothetical protein